MKLNLVYPPTRLILDYEWLNNDYGLMTMI